MTKARLAALGAALVALGAAAAPAHAAWHVTTLTSSETFLRGVDARPDRVPLILDERVSHGDSTLELRVGAQGAADDRRRPALLRRRARRPRRPRRARSSPGTTLTALRRPAPALRVVGRAAAPQQLTTGTLSTSVQSLDVAGDGGAVVTGWNSGGLVVARRAPGADALRPVPRRSPPTSTSVGRGGRARRPRDRGLVAAGPAADRRRRRAPVASGRPQAVALPPAPGGGTALRRRHRDLAATPTGRVVIAASTILDHDGDRSAGAARGQSSTGRRVQPRPAR